MLLSGRSIAFALHWVERACVCVCACECVLVSSYVEYSHYLLNLWMLICINTFATYLFSVVVDSLFVHYFADLWWRSLEMLRVVVVVDFLFVFFLSLSFSLSLCVCVFFRCVRFFSLYLLFLDTISSSISCATEWSSYKVSLLLFSSLSFNINRALIYIECKIISISSHF